MLITGGAAAGLGEIQSQAKPDAAKPAPTVSEKKPAAKPDEKIVGGYRVHQSLEVGGRIAKMGGSNAMWDTLVNQGSGGRILGQSLEMRSVNTSRTPFFDNLSTSSTGYGGDPLDVTRLKMSKGRWYDFNSSFRRDRNYFDYNLLDNSLLGPNALLAEPDSLHLFNTVRRNTDVNLTLLPLSFISLRGAFNHGTHEGPSYTSAHDGGDVQLLQWFRNSSDTYTGGVDIKFAPRTTLSYDQFFVFYKGDSSYSIAGANFPTLNGNGAMESLGVDTLSTATCGSGVNKSLEVVNGVANPYCSGTIAMNQNLPARTEFPTVQLRVSTHYWSRVSMNARVLYSGALGDVSNYKNTFDGFNSRGDLRSANVTGALSNGKFAETRRVNLNADYGIVAELSKHFAVSDAFNYWNFRTSGATAYTLSELSGTSATSILTPLASPPLTATTVIDSGAGFLDQKTPTNTAMVIATVAPQFKLSGGWRYRDRVISDPSAFALTWHGNGAILGAVIQPSRLVRINVDYDTMDSKYSSGTAVLNETAGQTLLAPANTFTRESPDKTNHIRARATVKPAKWIGFAITGNDYSGKNDDPLVNHFEHNRDFSFATSIVAGDGFSLDFNYARDSVYSVTDLCYIFTATAAAPLPTGAANAGTCVNSATNPEAAAGLYLGNGYYNVPTNFFAGAVNYAPSRFFRIDGAMRMSDSNGQAEQLNPLMVPGAIQSKYFTPHAGLQLDIAAGWTWHGNWAHNGYGEGGAIGLLPARDTHGDICTLGVEYAF